MADLDADKKPNVPPIDSDNLRWETGSMLIIDGMVTSDQEAPYLGVPSLVGTRADLPPGWDDDTPATPET